MIPARQLVLGGGAAPPATLPSVTLNTSPIAPENFAWLFLAAAVAVLFGAALLLGKVHDLYRKREAKRLALETKITECQLRDPSLVYLPVVATVQIPLWRGVPVTIEMTGSVPRPQLRQALLDLALREAKAGAGAVRLKDRIVVDPAIAKWAA